MSISEIHVAPSGSDAASGAAGSPLKRISAAAEIARPGDTVIVHEGLYREEVNPPRGGDSPDRRIVYQAAEGETVTVSGAEVVTGWTREDGELWQVKLPNAFFGDFNPYREEVTGDWFLPMDRVHHRGAVYLGDRWLPEAVSLAVLRSAEGQMHWYAEVDEHHTVIWLNTGGRDPNDGHTEINVRETVFYPRKPGCNYITLRGFRLCRAATQWAPPSAEQVALVGTHWSRGWLIEHNEIFQSRCVGLSLGKFGDDLDNQTGNSAEGHLAVIEHALAHSDHPWTREHIGHHVVRSNHIHHCEQAGIVGSMGGAFSRVEDNLVEDIYVQRLFRGAELAGIKLHNAIDTTFCGNTIRRSFRGLWLDWGTQGTRVTRNVLLDNDFEDLFVEVSHGPYVIDHNLFLSVRSLTNMSQGGAYLYNLFAGDLLGMYSGVRKTPVHAPHDVPITRVEPIQGGDDYYIGNLYFCREPFQSMVAAKRDPSYSDRQRQQAFQSRDGFPCVARGNIALSERPRCIESEPGMLNISFRFGPDVEGVVQQALATLDELEPPQVAGMPYSGIPESPLSFDHDYLGAKRSPLSTAPGPFEMENVADCLFTQTIQNALVSTDSTSRY